MPKAEKGSVKDIAKRIKAKGLQKLKFYCQLCEKQCRDANGFKCHLTSESHLRQMKLFSENAAGTMDRYSKEFEKIFLDNLRMRHTTTEVNANNVYQEVIRDKQHIHMNATIWATLTDFVKYLGKKGKCSVRETERGWYIQYIEQDVGKLARQDELQKRQLAEQEAEDALNERIERQRVEAAKAYDHAVDPTQPPPGTVTNLERSEPDETIHLTLKREKKKTSAVKASVFVEDGEDSDEDEEARPEVPPPPLLPSKKRSRSNPAEGDAKREKRESDDVWLFPGILVRIISKKLSDGKYYKRKGVIDRVLRDSKAQITLLDSGPDDDDGGDILTLAQKELETVVPKIGKSVLILRGRYSGKTARVVDLNPKKYRAAIALEDGTVLDRIDYDDISKLQS